MKRPSERQLAHIGTTAVSSQEKCLRLQNGCPFGNGQAYAGWLLERKAAGSLIHEDSFVTLEHAVEKIPAFFGSPETYKAIARFSVSAYDADVVCFTVHPRFFLKQMEVLVKRLFGTRQKHFSVEEKLISVFLQLWPRQLCANSAIVRFERGMIVGLYVRIVKHVDCIPRADGELVKLTAVVWRSIAHLASNAAAGVDLMIALRRHWTDHFVDAIHGADRRAGIAGCAVVFVDDIDVTSFLLPVRLSSPEVVGH